MRALAKVPADRFPTAQQFSIRSRMSMSAAGGRFSSDGSEIYFFGRPADGEWGIWSMPVTEGEPTRLVAFDDPSLPAVRFKLTDGPDHFYVTLSEYESDIWVMDLEY